MDASHAPARDESCRASKNTGPHQIRNRGKFGVSRKSIDKIPKKSLEKQGKKILKVKVDFPRKLFF
jgi:hypothetical protein